MIKEKLKAPNFKLPSTDNTVFELTKYLGKNIILFSIQEITQRAVP